MYVCTLVEWLMNDLLKSRIQRCKDSFIKSIAVWKKFIFHVFCLAIFFTRLLSSFYLDCQQYLVDIAIFALTIETFRKKKKKKTFLNVSHFLSLVLIVDARCKINLCLRVGRTMVEFAGGAYSRLGGERKLGRRHVLIKVPPRGMDAD